MKPKTITIQIGNSDDKLTQKQWARFVTETKIALDAHCVGTHFFGGCSNFLAWQNVAWVVTLEPAHEQSLIRRLLVLAEKYKQDSIAYTVGRTHFLTP